MKRANEYFLLVWIVIVIGIFSIFIMSEALGSYSDIVKVKVEIINE